VVVHASTEPEPFGRVIVEAQACGRPVIATQAGGAAELIDDGVNALGVPLRDSDALANAMERLADDADLRTKLGDAGRESAVAFFSRPRLGREIVGLYDGLLKPK
jgi:glycosyltransferase involved in cell wall biosynthesis